MKKITRDRERYTDLGNAKRLVAQFGDEIRYVSAWGKWLVWDDTRWVRDDAEKLMVSAKATIRALTSSCSNPRNAKPAGTWK